MSDVGSDLVEAVSEMAADLDGLEGAESYELEVEAMTPARIRALRSRLATSTLVFEREFAIPARTMEAFEQGRRRPDRATTALLRVIEREPEIVRRALAS